MADEGHLAEIVPLRQPTWRQCAMATFLAHLRWHREPPHRAPVRPRQPAPRDYRGDHPSWGSASPDDVA